MDNPVSWAILLALVIIGIMWFVAKCEDELERNHRENDDFFWTREHNYRE